MRVIENQQLYAVSGGATYNQILDKGVIYGGAIGVVLGFPIGAAMAGPIGLIAGPFYGFFLGSLAGLILAVPVAAVAGTSNYYY